MASANAGISQLQFEETMRSLRLTLRKDFYTILQLQRYANLYKAELEQISRLTTGMNAQYGRPAILPAKICCAYRPSR